MLALRSVVETLLVVPTTVKDEKSRKSSGPFTAGPKWRTRRRTRAGEAHVQPRPRRERRNPHLGRRRSRGPRRSRAGSTALSRRATARGSARRRAERPVSEVPPWRGGGRP